MKALKFLSLLLLISCQVAFAQEEAATKSQSASLNIGVGAGLTYGGLGARIVVNPSDVFGLFLALGYNLESVGFNVGPIVTIPSQSSTKFYLTAMYGYNGVIIVKDLEELNNTYYGVSAGAGIKLMSKRKPGSYWDFGLIAPFRSSDFKSDWDDIKNSSFIEVQSNPWPVVICVGYNFSL